MESGFFILHTCPFCDRKGFDTPAIIAHMAVYCRHIPDRGIVQCPICAVIVNVRGFDDHTKDQHYPAWKRSLII
jgi:hypothetical protein